MSAALASMTGYASATGESGGRIFQIEIRSVNARGLDIRTRVAPGLDAIEIETRKRVQAALTRGSVTVNISLKQANENGELVVNQQALGAILDAIDTLSGRLDMDRPRLDGILALKGVLEFRADAPVDAEMDALHEAVLALLEDVLVDLRRTREAEGAHLRDLIAECLDDIEALTETAENHPARTPGAIREKLADQIEALAPEGLSTERLHQEAAVLATKADIREELDRLTAHVDAARSLLSKGGPIGRKLDFLSQEFNREANTLCSKANAVELTAIGLDLKAKIDQMREQVQNLE